MEYRFAKLRRFACVVSQVASLIAAGCDRAAHAPAVQAVQAEALPQPPPDTPAPSGGPAASAPASPERRAAASDGGSLDWTAMAPHWTTRDGHRYAVAVGRARMSDAGLARQTATNRARAALVRFISEDGGGAFARGALQGSRVTRSTSEGGEVCVQVEVGAPESGGSSSLPGQD